jgi:hypothetical protein
MELVTLFEPSDPDAETHQLNAPPVVARAVIQAATQTKRAAVVVVGAGQIVTAIVLRSLGWHVELAKDIADAGRIARDVDATLLFVRITSSHLRSLRRPAVSDVHIVAIVDSPEDTPLPGFDATIAVDDVDALATYVRSIAPTCPSLPVS